MPAEDAAAPRRVVARCGFDGGAVLRNGMTICGVTRSSGRKSPGMEALSRCSVGVSNRGPGFAASGAEAGALGGGAAVCAVADTIAAASVAAAVAGNQ